MADRTKSANKVLFQSMALVVCVYFFLIYMGNITYKQSVCNDYADFIVSSVEMKKMNMSDSEILMVLKNKRNTSLILEAIKDADELDNLSKEEIYKECKSRKVIERI